MGKICCSWLWMIPRGVVDTMNVYEKNIIQIITSKSHLSRNAKRIQNIISAISYFCSVEIFGKKSYRRHVDEFLVLILVYTVPGGVNFIIKYQVWVRVLIWKLHILGPGQKWQPFSRKYFLMSKHNKCILVNLIHLNLFQWFKWQWFTTGSHHGLVPSIIRTNVDQVV